MTAEQSCLTGATPSWHHVVGNGLPATHHGDFGITGTSTPRPATSRRYRCRARGASPVRSPSSGGQRYVPGQLRGRFHHHHLHSALSLKTCSPMERWALVHFSIRPTRSEGRAMDHLSWPGQPPGEISEGQQGAEPEVPRWACPSQRERGIDEVRAVQEDEVSDGIGCHRARRRRARVRCLLVRARPQIGHRSAPRIRSDLWNFEFHDHEQHLHDPLCSGDLLPLRARALRRSSPQASPAAWSSASTTV